MNPFYCKQIGLCLFRCLRKRIRVFYAVFYAFFLIFLVLPVMLEADEVILKSGRTIKTEMAWEDEERVYCQISGGTISFPKKDVKKIIQNKNLEQEYPLSPSGRYILPSNTEPPSNLPKVHGSGSEVEDLVKATEKGDITAVKRLLKNGADVNGCYEGARVTVGYQNNARLVSKGWSDTPLMVAASRGDTSIVRLLLQYGADVNLRHASSRGLLSHGKGKSVLYLSVISNHKETLKALLNANPHPALVSDALCAATRNNLTEIVRIILDYGVDDIAKKKALEETGGGKTESVKLLEQSGTRNYEHRLMNAAEKGDLETVKSLLIKMDRKKIPKAFFKAVNHGQTDVVAYLTSFMEKEKLGKAVTIAASQGHGGTIEFLLNQPGVQPDLNFALLNLAKSGNTGVLDLLLRKGADINAKKSSYKSGATPLIEAVRNTRIEMVKALIARGADIQATDDRRLTALQWSIKGKDKQIETILKRAGARQGHQ